MSRFVLLRKGKEVSVLRGHPWVFSGAIQRVSPSLEQGDIVEVQQYDGTFIGKGHYQHGGSITVRMLTMKQEETDGDFWRRKISSAYMYRQRCGIIQKDITDTYRLVHGEGDLAPGLIVDVYGKIVVIQCHSIGMYRNRKEIADAIQEVLPEKNLHIYIRAKDTLPSLPGLVWEDGFLTGDLMETTVTENGHVFTVNVVEGQKTGFFLDQQENRLLLSRYAGGKTVLNTFCYTGGFSVYALKAGALHVDSVDISEKAMALTDKNVSLNPSSGIHHSFTENVMNFLNQQEVPSYDIVVVDPPAFAKSLAKRHNAVQAYKRLNILALQKVNPGGFMFTFSCSQVVTPQLFYNTIVAAGMESGRSIRVIRHLSQGADHPVSLFHPEGHYLKGLLLYVE